MNQPITISKIKDVVKNIDLFICSSSFESRCFVIAESIKDILIDKQKIVFYNENEYQEIISSSNTLATILGRNSFRINLDTNNPVSNAIRINEELQKILENGSIKRILLDSTTFTHETLLILYRFLEFKKDQYDELLMTYVGAKGYSIYEQEQSKKWLSAGISSIRSIVGYPGVSSPARENHLIVLFGFESDRTKNLIEDLQFDVVSLGFGAKDKSISLDSQNINYQRHCELMTNYNNANKFELSLVDPFESKDDIIEQINKYPDHNTVIAPMNNKLSTIGAGMASIEYPKAQLIYAKPKEYNTRGYSEAADTFYLYKVI